MARRHGVLPFLAGRRALPPGALRRARPRPGLRVCRRRCRRVVDARLPAPRRRHASLRRFVRRGGAPRGPCPTLLRRRPRLRCREVREIFDLLELMGLVSSCGQTFVRDWGQIGAQIAWNDVSAIRCTFCNHSAFLKLFFSPKLSWVTYIYADIK